MQQYVEKIVIPSTDTVKFQENVAADWDGLDRTVKIAKFCLDVSRALVRNL